DRARGTCRDAWLQWYKENRPAIKLTKPIGQRTLGYTILVYYLEATPDGSIVELDRNNKKRWEITNLRRPLAAQVLPGNRVLIAENDANLVSERDFKGKVLWQKALNSQPVSCQRLPNGHTFIATRNQ